MTKLTPHVFLIGSSSLSHTFDCMVYLVIGDNGCVMIDSGAGKSAVFLEKQIEKLGYSHGPDAIILTHCHIDHVGGAKHFQRKFGTRILAPEKDSDAIEARTVHLVAADWYGIEYDPVNIDDKITGGETRLIAGIEFQMIAIPGHTPGSIAVLVEIDNERVLFAQDVHGPFMTEWGSSIPQWRESMKLLIDLQPSILCEGHYGIFRGEEAAQFINSQLKSYS